MKLKHLKLDNFRCFESLEMDFGDITLILADNGGGKSSLLEAVQLAFGAYLHRMPNVSGVNPAKGKHLHISKEGKQSYYLRIDATLFDGTSWDRTGRRDRTKQTSSHIPGAKGLKDLNILVDKMVESFNSEEEFLLPVVLFYGTERSVTGEMPKRRRNWQKQFIPFDSMSEALSGSANFRRFLEWFDEMEDQERREREKQKSFDYTLPALDVVRRAIKKMVPQYDNPQIKKRPFRFVVESDGVEFRIDQLSDGYRMTLALVADIAGRLAEANPHLKDPLNAPGIVMIDEVDQHLHPRWQRKIVSDLHRTFPNIQFILTTHSPVVALGAPVNSKIVHLNDRHEIEEWPKTSLESFSVNRILVSDLFGLPSSQDPVWDDKIKKREKILQHEITEKNRDELESLNDELMPLSVESQEDLDARRIIREAAKALKQNRK